MKTLLCDTRQQNLKHDKKDAYFAEVGIPTYRSKLPVGDYTLMQDMSIVIDTKRNMQEICQNLCSSKKEHDRVAREADLARDNGIKLIYLIEDDGGYCDKNKTIRNKPCNSVEDVFSWKNPRAFIFVKGKQKYPRATKGSTLAKTMMTFAKHHGCEFRFCRSKDAGRVILEILGVIKNDKRGSKETS